jgi:DNA repair protein RadA/Sms
MARGMTLNVGINGLSRGTRLDQISVPDQLRVRLRTGLPFFDDALGGEGLVPSAVMMLTGTPGAGKTTMMLQLADSIVSQGHVCLYNTGEESLYQVKMVSERLRLKSGFVVGQDILVTDLLSHADYLREQNPGKQVFIIQDSLQTLDDGKYSTGANSATPLRCAEMLTDWAKTHFMNVAFVGQVTKDGTFSGKNAIMHAIDIRGSLYIDGDKKSETFGERIFEVKKNRFGPTGISQILGLNREGLYGKGSISWDT